CPDVAAVIAWTRRSLNAAAVITLTALMLAASVPSRAQIQPGALDKTRLRPDARSQAMGGVQLTLLDAAAGAIFNPALIADAGKGSVSMQAQANANFRYWEVRGFLDDLKQIAGQIKDDPNSVDWDAVKDEFDHLYNRVREIAGDIVAGKAVKGV